MNEYVRMSGAQALAEAVEHWPQSVTPVIASLQDFYREKVRSPSRKAYMPLMSFQAKILAPEFDQYVRSSPRQATRVDVGDYRA